MNNSSNPVFLFKRISPEVAKSVITNVYSYTLGFTVRTVECYRSQYSIGYQNVGRKVDKIDCIQDEMPLGSKECNLRCSGDCVLSEWSSWSSCFMPNKSIDTDTPSCHGTQRTRSKTVLRQHSMNTGTFRHSDLSFSLTAGYKYIWIKKKDNNYLLF